MIIQGDCIKEMRKLEENSIDAIITDPPYGLEFMGKEWDSPWKYNKMQPLSFMPNSRPMPSFNPNRNPSCKNCHKLKRGKKQCKCDNPQFDIQDKKIEDMKKLQDFMYSWAKECLRVLKPGGFLLSFGGTRTYHRLVCGIEDAGFEIRDTIMWLYGSGFPKSLNIGKQIDKRRDYKTITRFCKKIKEARLKLGLTKHQAFVKCNMEAKTFGGNSWFEDGRLPSKKDYILLKEGLNLNNLNALYDLAFEEAEREVVGKNSYTIPKEVYNIGEEKSGERGESLITAPATPEAKEWEGWGTALKPAVEPIVVARKPLSEKNVALNVLKWNTGGINIDACRIETEENLFGGAYLKEGKRKSLHGDNREGVAKGMFQEGKTADKNYVQPQGRFPANIILDEEVSKYADWCRFFYCAKASKSERNLGCEEIESKYQYQQNKWTENDYRKGKGEKTIEPRKNNHPTVKPIKLMEYLIKLVSREGATILDPFLGSGTTLIACQKLNRKGIGIEKEEEYIKIAKARLKPFIEQETL